jgi:hypothetical protein
MFNKVEGAERAESNISEERLAFLREKLNAGEITLPPELLEEARKQEVERRENILLTALQEQGKLPVNPHATVVPGFSDDQQVERTLEEAGQRSFIDGILRNITTKNGRVIKAALRMADEAGMFKDLEEAKKSKIRASRGRIEDL